MKTLSTGMRELLAGYKFFCADLYTLTLQNGEVYHWTGGDGDIALSIQSPPPYYTALLHFDSYPCVDTSGNNSNVYEFPSVSLRNGSSVFGNGCLAQNTRDGSLHITNPVTAQFKDGVTADVTVRFRFFMSSAISSNLGGIVSVGSLNIINMPFFTGLNIAGINVPFAIPADQWCAYSIERHNGLIYVYLDGVLQNAGFPLSVSLNAPNDISIGGFCNVPETRFIDEFMVLLGTSLAAGASRYSVETAPFPDGVANSSGDYVFKAVAIERDDIPHSVGVSVDDCKLTLYCDTSTNFGGLTAQAFALSGGLDNARMSIDLAVMPSYGDVSNGVINVFNGLVTDFEIDQQKLMLTVSTDSIVMDAQVPKLVYQPSCSHTLYDGGCMLNRDFFSENHTVSISENGWFGFSSNKETLFFYLGKITFTSGMNKGLSRSIKFHRLDNGLAGIIPTTPFPFAPAVGDRFTILPGCDKTRATCASKFNNAAHFFGFEYMPVPEASL